MIMENGKRIMKNFVSLLFLFFMSFSYSQAQGRTVRGKVVDVNGESLIGVNVIEKGTTNGTVTDIDGDYTFSVKENSTIVFSSIGFQTQEIQWNGESTLHVTLHEDSELLAEVVVVGYGIQRKINLSGSVEQVGAKELEVKPINVFGC
jgi:hypothetical protein